MTSKRNRPAPAYQEYAANMLADATFRAASVEAKGLMYQLRLECWANMGNVPSDQAYLAKYLGIALEDLRAAYPEISKFFKIDGEILRCPELDDYRAYLEENSRKQSEVG